MGPEGRSGLQLRLGLQARTTKDVDLLNTAFLSDLYASIAEGARTNLMDWFDCEVERPEASIENELGGKRFLVRCFLDGRTFENFHVDIGVGDIVLEPYDWLTFEPALSFADIQPTRVPCYPVVQQIAEKFHALTAPTRVI